MDIKLSPPPKQASQLPEGANTTQPQIKTSL